MSKSWQGTGREGSKKGTLARRNSTWKGPVAKKKKKTTTVICLKNPRKASLAKAERAREKV